MATTLAEAVAAERAGRRRSECQVGVLLKQLAATKAGHLAADLKTVLANSDISAPEISRGLKRLGHQIGPAPIARHRRRDCVCDQ